ncbi:MAG: cytochrome c [Chloroflexi bacterium]|nr:cytochrome c [Chloroflexota bacterium]
MRKRLLLFLTVLLLPALLAACGSNSPNTVDNPQVAAGLDLYNRNCQSCHGNAATGQGRIPLAPPHSSDGHTWHHADGQLVDLILGRLNYPGRVMPSFDRVLTEAQVMNILAYLKTNWSDEEREFQAEVSRNWETR